MLDLRTPNGLLAAVPETVAEDPSPHFDPSDGEGIRKYFAQHGYAVVSNVIPPEATRLARQLWADEIKPYRGKIYRQATAKLEPHRFNERGWVMNPILNLQSLDPRRFGGMRDHARRHIFAGLKDTLSNLLGETPKIVQSMYFEGNSATWEHHDSYYLDSEHIGSMVGSWVALEDISARAGRFFVVPGSHKLEWGKHSLADNVATAHDSYIQSVVRRMREQRAEVRAPALREGDVVFWHSLTIHGSLDSQDPERSRSSITCHAIPASHRFMQYHTRITDPAADEVGGVLIHAAKDLAHLRNRVIRALEDYAPGPFHMLKRAAIRAVVRQASSAAQYFHVPGLPPVVQLAPGLPAAAGAVNLTRSPAMNVPTPGLAVKP